MVQRRWMDCSRATFLVGLFAILTCAVLALPFVTGPSAAAELLPVRADDAVRACGVTTIDQANRGADVPAEYQDGYFMSVPTATDPVQLRCGNGKTTGAVHIEIKHDVPNWGDTLNCMANAISNGKSGPGKGRTEYVWSFGGKTVVVVVGEYSVITAYPLDGLEETWIECSAAA